MNNLAQAVWVELLKARRSKVPGFTALGFSMVPLAGGFFMIILKDPDLARRVGLISAKANLLAGAADWPSFLGVLSQGGIAGIILFGLIVSWVFGREYSDRTAKDILALPTSRSAIVLAKFIVVALWSAGLTIWIYLLGLGVGAAVGLPPAPAEVFRHGAVVLAVCSGLALAVVTPFAYFAGVGHGDLAPMGAAFLALFLGQVILAIGWGAYFPWSIPAVYVQGEVLGPASYAISLLTSAAGIAATLLWWERADQTH